MRRLPAIAFGALVLLTVAAFFITQHLKTSDPLIANFRPVPGWINPVAGRVCAFKQVPTSFRTMTISFDLPDHSDDVGVFIVDPEGNTVRTVGWQQMHEGRTANFIWNGREDDRSVAPNGTYYVRVALKSEGRSFTLPNPVHVATGAPSTRVLRVTPGTLGSGSVSVRFRPRNYRTAELVVYRSTIGGHLRAVAQVPVSGHRGVGRWNGQIDGHRAPDGTYLIGVRVADLACNAGRFPATNPPASRAATAGAGLTVRRLAVTPQLYPVAAGSEATVYVDSGGTSYSWALRRPGVTRSILHGTVAAAHGNATGPAGAPLHFRIPGIAAGLYVLTVKGAGDVLSVPVVASTPRGARVLVVVPALSWQGENPVDDDGNGIPDTLIAGDRIDLNRPLVTGLPAGYADTTALLRYLRAMHLAYQLTTDVELAEGVGPGLGGHGGVILAGSFRWLPSGVATALRRYVQDGGQVLAFGLDSLQAVAHVKPGGPHSSTGPTAGPPVALRVDPFGVRHGQEAKVGDALITTLADPLRIFAEASAFTGFAEYQALAPPAGVTASLAGVGAGAPAIVGFRLGSGTVIEAALPGFGENLHRDAATRAFLGQVYKRLHR